jgi:hypothetical protein
VLVYNVEGYRKAQSEAVLARGEERIENFAESGSRNTASVVPDADYGVLLLDAGRYFDLTASGARLHSIDCQV